MTKNMFVYVTENGTFYDRTDTRNLRLFPNKKYKLEVGTVEFTMVDSKLVVTRYTEENKEIFKREITQSGLYLISALFIQPLPKSSKELRTLFNRLKDSLGKPCFKIEAKPNLRSEFTIKLHTWLDKGFKYRFLISVKDQNVSADQMREITELVVEASKLNLRAFLEYHNAFNNTGVVVTINRSFLDEFNDYMKEAQKTVVAHQV